MNQKSLKLTTGAMVTAIFGVMMLLNRQTGNLFEEVFVFLYPIPMVAFAAMYGVKSGLPVLLAMSLLSFLYGNFTSIFYALTQAAIGLVFGGCLYHKVDITKTLFAVMALSAIVSVANTVVLGFLFGFDINQEVAEMQTMMNSAFEQAGVTAVSEQILSTDYLKQLFVISMVLMGALQGFLVYEISLLILRRLRFPVQKPKSVYLYAPPTWSAYVALIAFGAYTYKLAQPVAEPLIQNLVLTVGILGYLYLVCFGIVSISHMFKIRRGKVGALGVLVCILLTLMFPLVVAVAGFFYVAHYRDRFNQTRS